MDIETDSVPGMAPSNFYDAAILYSALDTDQAKKTMDMMNGIDLGDGYKPSVCLYDDPQFRPSRVKGVCDVVRHCSFLFCLLTKNFNKDDHSDLFKDEAIGITRLEVCECNVPPTYAQKQYYCVRPLHTLPKDSRNYRIPLGLTTIVGFDLYNPFIEDKLKEFFNHFKNEKRNRHNSAEIPHSLTSTPSQSALALPERDIMLDSQRRPQVSTFSYGSQAASFVKLDSSKADIMTTDVPTPIERSCPLPERYLTDSAYGSHSANNSCDPSISISVRDYTTDTPSLTSITTHLPVQQSSELENRPPHHYPFSEVIENGRLVEWGNQRSSKNLMDSKPLPTPEGKKSNRRPRPKSVHLVNCNIVQIDRGAAYPTDSNHSKFLQQHEEDNTDSDSEWSNDDPVIPSFNTMVPPSFIQTANDVLGSEPTETRLNDNLMSIQVESSAAELTQIYHKDTCEERSSDLITPVHDDLIEEQDTEVSNNFAHQSLPGTYADAQEALGQEPNWSIQIIGQESYGDDVCNTVPLVVNQDQDQEFRDTFESGLPSRFTCRFSHPGTSPFSYHSLHSAYWPDRQMSVVDVARLTGLYKSQCMESIDLD